MSGASPEAAVRQQGRTLRLSEGTSANHSVPPLYLLMPLAVKGGSVIKEYYSRGTPPMGTMRGFCRGIVAVGAACSVQPERIPSPLRVCTGGVLESPEC
jgi:hypothetical protein